MTDKKILSFPIKDSGFSGRLWRRANNKTQWTPLKGDAGFRLYFRGQNDDGRSWILMRDTDTVQLKKFIEVRAYLSQAGVSVPRIIAVDKNAGLALLQDFGDNTYLNIIGNEKTCYAAAWRALIKIQRLPKKKLLPPYNATLLKTETALFKEWYCSRYLERRLTAAEEKVFIAAENFIVRSAVRQPQVVVHRDYHSRNLMLLKGNANPGILDFQDAVIGPMVYDMASLLRDAYRKWPEVRQQEWLYAYWQKARAAGLPAPKNFAVFWRQYHIISAQRGLKVLGIFAAWPCETANAPT